MKNLLLIFILLSFSCKQDDSVTPPTNPPTETPNNSVFFTGMDLSYQPFLENQNTIFKQEDGTAIPNLLQYVKDNGTNLIRLRLFHTPVASTPVVHSSNLTAVLAYAKQIDATDNKILLDIHYSDTWADPSQQTIPQAWQGLSFEVLKDSVYQYTKSVLEAFQAQNTLPYMVQIGNETNSGFLWDHGKVWGDFENNWANYAALINTAHQTIKEIATANNQEIYTMKHHAGIVDATYYFEKLTAENTTFDVIGLSYYNAWHNKDLNKVQDALNQLSNTFKKPIMIVETAYPWTLSWNDWTNNVVGTEDQLIAGYAATPEGQKAFYEQLVTMLKAIPDGNGLGFVLWAPDYVAFDGQQSTEGSAFENLTIFDFDNKVLPAMDVFSDN